MTDPRLEMHALNGDDSWSPAVAITYIPLGDTWERVRPMAAWVEIRIVSHRVPGNDPAAAETRVHVRPMGTRQ